MTAMLEDTLPGLNTRTTPRGYIPTGNPAAPNPNTWPAQAACATTPAVMYPADAYTDTMPGDTLTTDPVVTATGYDRARAVCATCPVLEQCREWGLRTGEPFGMWGGLTPEERDRILGRKPKHM